MNLKFLSLSFFAIMLFGCGSTPEILSTPVENIDTMPLKVTELTEDEKKVWGHLDLVQDTVPGMSVNKAYDEILKGKKGSKVIVAVIDSGIDIDHEDLDNVIWTNRDEIPNNNQDDDKNGYVDDIHGWNFLGQTNYEQLEYVRLLASGNTSHPRFAEAQAELEKERAEATGNKARYEQILEAVKGAHETVSQHLGKTDYTPEEVNAIKTENEELARSKSILQQMYDFGFDSSLAVIDELEGGIKYFDERLNYHFNLEFNGRKNGDDPDDFTSRFYGDNNVKPFDKDEAHGTHVAGIIAAERNNGKGVNGVANNVEIMAIRAVPNGDEYDKDIALAIRYAVDNGAKIINTSFGKAYSPYSEKVREAIAYAGSNDVLIVNAAGNESIDLDKKDTYPNDAVGVGPEVSDNFISVGSLTSSYGSKMVSGFSNYGKVNVDVFAPGSDIYSTTPENEYESQGGTSMASPAVAGVAALIRSQYPKLTASQVKEIIINSGVPINTKVIVGGDASDVRAFSALSKSGKIVNAYNALIMASQMVNN